MDEIDFTLDGARYTLTREQVVKSMRRQTPGRIQKYAVEIEGVRFPVKQVLAQATRVPVTRFVSTRAQDLLSKLGFQVFSVDTGSRDEPGDPAVSASRALALELAVELLARRPAATVGDVLGAASSFEAWLAGSSGAIADTA